MKALLVSVILFAQSAFGLIGENEKQIEARYGKPKKVINESGESRVGSYIAYNFAIHVRFIAGISKTEWFEPLDKSRFTDDAIQMILAISAETGQTWQSTPLPRPNSPLSWTRSDNKVSAIAAGNLLNVYGNYVQPELSRTNEDVGPKSDTNAPSGRYRIIRNLADPKGLRMDDILRFENKSKPDAILKGPTKADTFGPQSRGIVNLDYEPQYFISPDEQWIIRDQKVGAGCNALILYRVEPSGRVQRFPLNLPAFNCAGVHIDFYGHLGVQFMSWDTKAGLAHLELAIGQPLPLERKAFSKAEVPPDLTGRPVSYDLNKHKMINDDPNWKPRS